MRRFLITAIKIYHACLAPYLGPNCRFYPSCSRYAIDSITRYGVFKGLVKASFRIMRCNPLSSAGYDPVK